MGGDDDTLHGLTLGDAEATGAPPDASGTAFTIAPTDAFEERYRRGEQIGRGGMGEVHLVADRWMAREIAIKTMRPGASARSRERFLREARIQGQLQHPSIVPVHDLGLDPEGSPYFTMKALRGTTLREILDRVRSGDPEALESYGRARLLGVFVDVCQAVAFAHERSVLHRDLKPANVMVGDFGEVYVLDWGVAKAGADTDDDGSSSSHPAIETGDTPATQAGAVIGTPGYMSPEQVRSDPTDQRSDIYALGALLFELLFFEPLHGGSNALVRAASTSVGIKWDERLASIDIEAPPELVQICRRASAIRPEDRYPTVRKLLADVEQYLEGTRDLALRREMADQHVRRARERLDEAKRSEALRELGRAIALQPDHAAATRMLEALFVETPDELPDAVAEDFDRSELVASQSQARIAAITYLLWLGIPLYMIWMGVREWPFVVGFAVLAPLTAIVAFVYAGKQRPPRYLVGLSAVLNVAMLLLTSRLFGPLFVTTAIAAVYGLGFVLNPVVRRPFVYLLGFSGTFLAPWALEHLGVLSSTYSFEGGRLTIAANVVAFDAFPTELFLLTNGLLILVFSALTVLRLRGSLAEARRRLHLQTWQLRQLVPVRAR